MHTEKQVRNTPSRMFRQPEGKGTQQFRLRDNRGSAAPILDNRSSSVLQSRWMNSIPCMQRMLPNDPDLTPSGGQAKVWLSKRYERSEGILCNDISVEKGSNKAEALKNISTKASDIGAKATTDNWAIEDAGNDKYNAQASTKMNPFQVPITAEYPLDQTDATIRLFYHYGPYNRGYIVKVELGYNGSVETGTMVDKPQLGKNEYSNKHDDKDTSLILNQTEGQDNTKKYDAYTKLAGEGARFQCVRDNIDKVKNNTWFYINGKIEVKKNRIISDETKPVENPGVDFELLWNSWSYAFKSKFGISNQEVKDKIIDGYFGTKSTTDKTDKIGL